MPGATGHGWCRSGWRSGSRAGVVQLDFTEAIIASPELHIDADVRSGVLALVTKPGIEVDLDDVSTGSGIARVERRKAPPSR